MQSMGEPRGRRDLLLALGVVVLIAAGVAGALIANAVNSPSGATTTTTAAAASSCDATSIAAQELPSVVTIFAGSGPSAGVGSGEVIRSDGYILTNNHVILPGGRRRSASGRIR
jgi:putative serine protease PepD